MNAPVRLETSEEQVANRLHGLVRLGSLYAALSIDNIREVVPRPARLVPFPATMDHILGAIELRGAIIPVLDLAVVLGDKERVGVAPTIMVLRVDGQLFGIGIHEICGVVELDNHHQTRVNIASAGESDASSLLILSGFALGEWQGVVLDAAAIAALPGLALAHERRNVGDRVSQVGVPTLMFSLGAFHFGLTASLIEACVPRGTVARSPLDDPLWIGMISHNGRKVAVVDTLVLLGLGRCEPAAAYSCVIFRMPHGALVGLRIDSVENILRIRSQEQWSLQDFPMARIDLLAGLHEAVHVSLVINGQALQAEEMLGDIARLEETEVARGMQKAVAQSSSGGKGTRNRQPFLIVMIAGNDFAIPLDQVDEILPVEARTRISLPAQTNGIVGMIAHRGSGVPLYDLAWHLSLAGDQEHVTKGYIVLAIAEGRRLGFLLDGLVAVERTFLQELTSGAGRATAPSPLGLPLKTIRTAQGNSCGVLDLVTVIGSVGLPGPANVPTSTLKPPVVADSATDQKN